MLLRRVLPAGDEVCELSEANADDVLQRWYRPDGSTSVRIMMIATLDGHTVGDDGTSASLSSPADRRIVRAIRHTADAIIVGAETVRREAIGRPAGTAVAVVTGSGALEGHRLRPAEDGAALLIVTTPRGAPRAARALGSIPHDLLVLDDAGDGRIPARSVLTAVRDRTGPHLVCEGGPSLARQLIDEGLATELCLTTATAVGGMAPLSPAGDSVVHLDPRQLVVADDGVVFARWTIRGENRATKRSPG